MLVLMLLFFWCCQVRNLDFYRDRRFEKQPEETRGAPVFSIFFGGPKISLVS